MNKIMATLLLLVFSFLLIFLLVKTNLGITKHDAVITSLEKNISSSLNSHFALGYRNLSTGISVADVKSFENQLGSLMTEHSTVKLEKSNDLKIDYLVEKKDGSQSIQTLTTLKNDMKIKAVKIYYQFEGSEYVVRYVIDENTKGIAR